MESKEKNYLRNRKIANAVLLLSAIFTILTLVLEKIIGKSIPLSFFQFLWEAVLIASVADGIAIYALTHKIPFLEKYTGLVQNKRQELLDGVVKASEDQFFPKESILEKMENIDGKEILELGKGQIRKRMLDTSTNAYLSDFIDKNKEEWSFKIEEILIQKGEELSLEKQMGFLETREFKENQIIWIIRGIDKAKEKIGTESTYLWIREELQKMVLERKKEGSLVRRMMTKATVSAMEKTKTIHYSELARDIQETLIKSLDEIQSEIKEGEGEYGILLRSELVRILDEIKGSPEILEELDHWKLQMIHTLPLKEYISTALESISKWIREEDQKIPGTARSFSLGDRVGDSFEKAIDTMEEKGELSKEIKILMARLADSQYDSILLLLEELLSKLTDEHIIKKINDIAGGNLQWLRISGAYVGAFAGVFLFLMITFPKVFLPLSILLFFVLKFSPTARERLVYYKQDEES